MTNQNQLTAWLVRYVQLPGGAACPRCARPLSPHTPQRCTACKADIELTLGAATPFQWLWALTLAVLGAGSGFGLLVLLIGLVLPGDFLAGWPRSVIVGTALLMLLLAIAALGLRRRYWRLPASLRWSGFVFAVALISIIFAVFLLEWRM